MKIVRRTHVDDSALEDTIADPILRQILASRGFSDPQDLDDSPKHLLHYGTLADIDKAADRFAQAVLNDEKIMIMGDYDVDGITGTALGVLVSRALGAKHVDYMVPSRYDTGYGMSLDSVRKAKALGTTLIVTVDNGISCFEAVEFAADIGIDVIITDHHEVGEQMPKAYAVVNPKRPDCAFPSKNLCGAGVLFYLLIALRAKLVQSGAFDNKEAPILGSYLDLVAIGTIGDVVSLDPNNRRLVKAGLNRIARGSCQTGVKALSEVARINTAQISSYNISFDLCPRLNAAGRIVLDDNPSILCLLSQDIDEALELAMRLDFCNKRRSDYERVFLQEAIDKACLQEHKSSIVVFQENWLTGISGLLASRLKDKYKRPCFVFAGKGDEITGSGRSVANFPLASIMQEIDKRQPGLLLRYGGHAMAAGATILKDDLNTFIDAFEDAANSLLDSPSEYEVLSDGPLPNNYFNLNFAHLLEDYGPWGSGFAEPNFDGEFIIEDMKLMAGRHIRFRLRTDDNTLHINAIRFRASEEEKSLSPGCRIKAVFSLGVDRYNNTEKMTVKLEALECI